MSSSCDADGMESGTRSEERCGSGRIIKQARWADEGQCLREDFMESFIILNIINFVDVIRRKDKVS